MTGVNRAAPEPIAIIGMAGIFPKAPDIRAFWRNILAGVDAVGEPLPEWEADRYLDSRRINTSHGGYLRELYRFDPGEFGIMPNSVDGGEPDQFLALRVARDALQDAGYLGGGYDHRETGIVLGHSTYLHRGQINHVQHHIVLDQTVELLKAVFPALDESRVAAVRSFLEKKLPPSNADIAPGLVPNVMTGRIANRLDLKGPNYLIDAACSSSLLAVSAAVDELRNRRSRMMLAGGVNASLPAEVSVIFTQLGALSRRAKVRPFEEGSDGTLLGEGLGVVVLKRVSDAMADGDRIYAVILGVGQASDGRGHGLLAPSVEGEALAIERAYESACVDPATIELVEAHGTGIALGDQTEVSALRKVFGERRAVQGSVAIGSVKSMISHCIPAAGIAGLIKTAHALHYRILPPTLCEKVSAGLGIEGTPFYVNTSSRPWISAPGSLRRAGISSFGFGGINTHAIIEEAPAEACRPPLFDIRPAELCVFSAGSDEELTGKLNKLADLLEKEPDCLPGNVAASLAAGDEGGPCRLAFVVTDRKDLSKKTGQALKRLKDGREVRWSMRNGVSYSRSPVKGKTAFMFPGEGSQYLNMFADLAMYFEEVRGWFDFWRGLYPDAPGEGRTDILFPPESELTDERRQQLESRLNDMDVGSEAVFVGDQAMYSLLTSLGVRPDVMVGHSTGESSALVASGAMEFSDLLQLGDFIRELNGVYRRVLDEGKIPTGALLAVGALPRETVSAHIEALGRPDVEIAMDNCSNQLVIYGDRDSIDSLRESLGSEGGICVPLPFDRGYHTKGFKAVSEAFLDYYERIGLKCPALPLYSCASAGLFPGDPRGVRALAAGQWSNKVRFRETVLNMYEEGVRYFIEVGPSGNLSSFVKDILAGREHLSLATDYRRKNSLEQFLGLLAQLYVNCREVDISRLFGSHQGAVAGQEKGGKKSGMYVANTMPVMHMDDADRAFLTEVLSRPGSENNKRRDAEKDSFSGAKTDDFMAEYFGLVGGLLERQKALLEGWAPAGDAILQAVDGPVDAYTPFLSSIIERDERHLVGECRLSVYEDNFLRDHVLSGPVSGDDPDLVGLSCVPLMVSLEIMAEACALLSGNIAVGAIEKVRASDWIALDEGEITLVVRAESEGAGRYSASLLNAGTVVVSADFCFEAVPEIEGLPPLDQRREYRWSGGELYTTGMFHGPVFQSIRRIDGWSGQGIDATLSDVSLEGFFDEGDTPSLVLNPVLLDALGQLVAYWIAQQVGTDFNSFPASIERIEIYEQCPHDIPGLSLRARQRPLGPASGGTESRREWRLECLDGEGRPLLRAANLVSSFFDVPHSFYEFRRDPLGGWLGHPVGTGKVRDVTVWELPHLPEKFCMRSGGIFLRIVAHALLSYDELNEWLDMGENIRQRREWLLGRACIKEAVRFRIYQDTGRLLYPSDIVVYHDEAGAPHVDGLWADEVMSPPGVSLSHDRRLSMAAVVSPSNRVGVDVEQIGRIERPDLIGGALSAGEKLLLNGLEGRDLDDRVLRIWCAKEAAAKYLGLGLRGTPERFVVSFEDETCGMAHVKYDEIVVEVDVRRKDDSIVALAAGHSHNGRGVRL